VEAAGTEGDQSVLRFIENDAPTPVRAVEADLLIFEAFAFDRLNRRQLQCHRATAVALIQSQIEIRHILECECRRGYSKVKAAIRAANPL
jgi:hypothetical protein